MATRKAAKIVRGGAKENHWFYSKSPAAQKAYIASHPNSVYAKNAARLKAKHSASRLTPERRQALLDEKNAQDRQRAKVFNERKNQKYDPKVHAEDMKNREKSRKLYQRKVDSHAKKIDAAKARVDKHKASGSPRLKAAERDLSKLKIEHGSFKKIVTGIDRMAKSAQKAYDKHHGKAPKKRATKRPSVEP